MTTILIVDDSSFMRSILRGILQSNGYIVIGEASNGKEAIKKQKELKPDITMLDITMNECDGLKALKKIMKNDPYARVIMCSAMGQKCNIIESIKLGAKDFIVKPFDKKRVLEAVRHCSLTAADININKPAN